MLQVEGQPPATKTVRVFVGLKIMPEIAQKLAQLARGLERFPTRFVASEDIHLTLVRPWDEGSIPDTIEKLREALKGSAPFMLTFTRPSYWPDRRHPRLLCAECVMTPEIKSLQSTLLSAFGQKGDRPFEPHVTLARMARGAAGRNEPDHDLTLAQSINSVQLFQSRMEASKGYHILASLPLATSS